MITYYYGLRKDVRDSDLIFKSIRTLRLKALKPKIVLFKFYCLWLFTATLRADMRSKRNHLFSRFIEEICNFKFKYTTYCDFLYYESSF